MISMHMQFALVTVVTTQMAVGYPHF